MLDLELVPGQHLKKLVGRAEAAGQGDEGVGQLGHQSLALVHVGDDAHVGHLGMGQFPLHQDLRNDADHLAALFEHAVGQDAHQTDVAAPEHQAEPLPAQLPPQFAGRVGIDRSPAAARTTENTDALHRITHQRKKVNVGSLRHSRGDFSVD